MFQMPVWPLNVIVVDIICQKREVFLSQWLIERYGNEILSSGVQNTPADTVYEAGG